MCRREGIHFDMARAKSSFTASSLLSGDPAPKAAPPPAAAAPTASPAPAGAIGCDLQEVEEFRALIQSSDYKACPFLTDIFSPREIAYCENQPEPVTSLCGLFAAKEALFKAGAPEPKAQPEITHKDGAPTVPGYAVSISHSGAYAMAVALKAAPAPAAPPAAAAFQHVVPSSPSTGSKGGLGTRLRGLFGG